MLLAHERLLSPLPLPEADVSFFQLCLDAFRPLGAFTYKSENTLLFYVLFLLLLLLLLILLVMAALGDAAMSCAREIRELNQEKYALLFEVSQGANQKRSHLSTVTATQGTLQPPCEGDARAESEEKCATTRNKVATKGSKSRHPQLSSECGRVSAAVSPLQSVWVVSGGGGSMNKHP